MSALVGLSVLLDATVGIATARAELELRVAIEENTNQVQVGSSTRAFLKNEAGQVLAEIPPGYIVAQSNAGQVKVHTWQDGKFWIEPTDGGAVFIDGKWYRGRAKVVATVGGLAAVNYVDLEHYLYSVVGAEMPTNWPIESLKAQAVAARTYALYQREHNANTVFDVGDTTAWQVYDGLEEETQSTQVAVNSTTGQVLTYNGRMIEAVFHSSSGGHTENVEDVWSSPRPYLRGVPDFDQSAPVYQWIETVSADSIQSKIPGIGNVLRFEIEPNQRTPRGRVNSVRVVGDRGSRVLRGDEIRRLFGLRSTLFSVAPQLSPVASLGNLPTVPTTFQFSGRGFGHGIGMSQWGAYQMAQQGHGYQAILGHYYQNSTLSRIRVE
jgi:stage II sporulation protein D